MSVYDDVKKALLDFLAPEVQEIKGELKAINIRLDAADKLAEARFASIMRELALDKRITNLERDREDGKREGPN